MATAIPLTISSCGVCATCQWPSRRGGRKTKNQVLNRPLQITCSSSSSSSSNNSWGSDPERGGIRSIVLSLVGVMGGLGVVLASPALSWPPAHEFVETASDVDAGGCPARGPGAPLSLLLRYPRRLRDASFPLLSLDSILREGSGESMGVSYGQIVAARDDKSAKQEMYTRDAWMGMRRVEQYGRLVESMAGKEKLCKDCVRNRRLLEQVWQTVSNDYYDQFGSFSQSQWAGELYRTLSKAGGLLETKAETY